MPSQECSDGDSTEVAPSVTPHPQHGWDDIRAVPTVVHALHAWAALTPSKTALTWVDVKGKPEMTLTYSELLRRSSAVATALRTTWKLKPGDKALLLYPMGLEFVIAFWGCLQAGVVAVPQYPPAPGSLARDVERLLVTTADCTPSVVLTESSYRRSITVLNVAEVAKGVILRWPEVPWRSTNLLKPNTTDSSGSIGHPSVHDLAFIQYTSGSTSDPKGVMVSHGNLIANIHASRSAVQVGPADVLVSWLPQYHDMGLITYFINTIAVGASCVACSPFDFIRRPSIWMQLMSQYKGTVSSAPNFGFALAARKTDAEAVKQLSLRHVRILMDAAEPVREANVRAFLSRFQPAGITPGVYTPGYGLAEHVIFVSGKRKAGPNAPTVLALVKADLEVDNTATVLSEEQMRQYDVAPYQRLVGCGMPMASVEVQCVQVETHEALGERRVGEIWIHGPSVAQGYWGKEDLTRDMFGAQLTTPDNQQPASDAKKYLRTGDLGFLHEGELFVCGRLKDLIILGGRNICPQDVEKEAEESHAGLRPGCSAAFGVEKHNEEHLILVAEVREKDLSIKQLDDICYAVCARVQQAHRLAIHTLVLINPRSISKTTSGKIRRRLCRAKFLEGELDLVHKVTAPHQFALLPSHKPTILPAAAAALSKERETVHLATTPTFKGGKAKANSTSQAQAKPEEVKKVKPAPAAVEVVASRGSWWREALGMDEEDSTPLSTVVLAVMLALLLAWHLQAAHV